MTEAFVEEFTFQISQNRGEILVNGGGFSPDIHRINDQLFHIIMNGKSFDLFVHKIDREAKTVELSLNGKKTTVKLVSRIEKLLKELGMDQHMSKKLDNLKAPMPGLIHSIKVQPGQQVKKGDSLLILEAMKMENVIKSPGEGVVTKIHVEAKESVEKGHVLISFG